MHLSWFDLLLLASVFGYVWGGFWTGLIQSIGGLVGLFLGEIIASRYYVHFSSAVAPVFNANQILAKVFAFILIFMIVSQLVGLAFTVVNRIFKFIAIVPGLKLLNHLGGAIFGFLQGALFVGITLQFISRLPISTPFAGTIAQSNVAPYFLHLTSWLVPLFPGALQDATNAVNTFLPKNINATMNVNSAVNAAKTLTNSGLIH